MAKQNPFIKSIENPGAWTLFKWTIFEPVLLKRYSDTLTRWHGIKKFLSVYFPFITPLIIAAYLLGVLIVVGLDLPAVFPDIFTADFNKAREVSHSFMEKFWKYVAHAWTDLGFGLGFGLIGCIGVGLGGRLAVGLVFALVGVLTAGLVAILGIGLDVGLLSGSLVGLLSGSLVGLIAGLKRERLKEAIKIYLVFGLAFGLFVGLFVGLSGENTDISNKLLIAAQIGWTVMLYFLLFMLFGIGIFLRFFVYPFYIAKYAFKQISFYRNPYLHDGYIYPTIKPIDKQIVLFARKDPKTADDFIEFLLKFRPLQGKLAMQLIHAAIGGEWRQFTQIHSKAVYLPFVIEKLKDFVPTETWDEKILEIKAMLEFIELQTNIGNQVRGMEDCLKLINELQKIHLLETFKGKEEYTEAFGHWQRLAEDQLEELRQQAKLLQPITPNPYSKGKALSPKEYDVFLGREDLKEAISLKILTSKSMPMFLVQGQRRVGKTSLLKFLPQMLNPGRFKLVYQDLQDKGVNKDVLAWLRDLRYRVNNALNIKEEKEWEAPGDWIEAWHELAQYLTAISESFTFKIILAFDEYEKLHHLLQEDPEKGGDLLSTMRSFSQHQDKIAFMFIGAAFFYELENPAWSKYFVQAERFKVDYLDEKDSMRLITKPVPEFLLQYETGLPERMYQMTQGHPHLLQAICSELVDLANRTNKGVVAATDLELVLKEHILDRDVQPFSVFWIEFCEKQDMRKTVMDICKGKTPQHEPSLRRLLEYAYVLENEDRYEMRVPLFAEWVRKFGYVES